MSAPTGDMGGLHKLNPGWGMWFKGFAEADDWLAFDSNDEECEQRSYAENDRYCEWAHWRNAWEAQGSPEF